jgi:hypothetical protein
MWQDEHYFIRQLLRQGKKGANRAIIVCPHDRRGQETAALFADRSAQVESQGRARDGLWREARVVATGQQMQPLTRQRSRREERENKPGKAPWLGRHAHDNSR